MKVLHPWTQHPSRGGPETVGANEPPGLNDLDIWASGTSQTWKPSRSLNKTQVDSSGNDFHLIKKFRLHFI